MQSPPAAPASASASAVADAHRIYLPDRNGLSNGLSVLPEKDFKFFANVDHSNAKSFYFYDGTYFAVDVKCHERPEDYARQAWTIELVPDADSKAFDAAPVLDARIPRDKKGQVVDPAAVPLPLVLSADEKELRLKGGVIPYPDDEKSEAVRKLDSLTDSEIGTYITLFAMSLRNPVTDTLFGVIKAQCTPKDDLDTGRRLIFMGGDHLRMRLQATVLDRLGMLHNFNVGHAERTKKPGAIFSLGGVLLRRKAGPEAKEYRFFRQALSTPDTGFHLSALRTMTVADGSKEVSLSRIALFIMGFLLVERGHENRSPLPSPVASGDGPGSEQGQAQSMGWNDDNDPLTTVCESRDEKTKTYRLHVPNDKDPDLCVADPSAAPGKMPLYRLVANRLAGSAPSALCIGSSSDETFIREFQRRRLWTGASSFSKSELVNARLQDLKGSEMALMADVNDALQRAHRAGESALSVIQMRHIRGLVKAILAVLLQANAVKGGNALCQSFLGALIDHRPTETIATILREELAKLKQRPDAPRPPRAAPAAAAAASVAAAAASATQVDEDVKIVDAPDKAASKGEKRKFGQTLATSAPPKAPSSNDKKPDVDLVGEQPEPMEPVTDDAASVPAAAVAAAEVSATPAVAAVAAADAAPAAAPPALPANANGERPAKKAKLSEIDDALKSMRAELNDFKREIRSYVDDALKSVLAEVKDHKLAVDSQDRGLNILRGDVNHIRSLCVTGHATQAVHMNAITALEDRCVAIETALSRPLLILPAAPADSKPAAMNVG